MVTTFGCAWLIATVSLGLHVADEATHDFLARIHPVGRMGAVQDIVDAVLYLESASFVTGEILHVDGGATAGVG